MTTLRFTALALFFVLISGCAPALPTATAIPTEDKRALATEIAADIFATQKASLPTASSTPTATDTPVEPPTPTLTITPTSLPTNTATVTPLPTPVVPQGWKIYTSITRKFSLALPASFRLQNEQPGYSGWKGPDLDIVGVVLSTESIDEHSETGMDVAIERTANAGKAGYETFKLRASDYWTDGIHNGYVVEGTAGETLSPSGKLVIGGNEMYTIVMPWRTGSLSVVYIQMTFDGNPIAISKRDMVNAIALTLR